MVSWFVLLDLFVYLILWSCRATEPHRDWHGDDEQWDEGGREAHHGNGKVVRTLCLPLEQVGPDSDQYLYLKSIGAMLWIRYGTNRKRTTKSGLLSYIFLNLSHIFENSVLSDNTKKQFLRWFLLRRNLYFLFVFPIFLAARKIKNLTSRCRMIFLLFWYKKGENISSLDGLTEGV